MSKMTWKATKSVVLKVSLTSTTDFHLALRTTLYQRSSGVEAPGLVAQKMRIALWLTTFNPTPMAPQWDRTVNSGAVGLRSR